MGQERSLWSLGPPLRFGPLPKTLSINMDIINKLKEFSNTHNMENVGLHMTDELIEEWYDSSPLNCMAFATTGGDGVHFSIFKSIDIDKSPVVMTVPMNFGEENMIIARTLSEFLCLGSRFGFFNLEQLSYKFETTTQKIEASNLTEPPNSELRELTEIFSLEPIREVSEYIKETNAKYFNQLELADA